MSVLCVRYPALPFLSEIIQSSFTSILATTSVNYLRRNVLAQFQEALEFEVKSFEDFKAQVIAHIRDVVAQRVNDIKAVPILSLIHI